MLKFARNASKVHGSTALPAATAWNLYASRRAAEALAAGVTAETVGLTSNERSSRLRHRGVAQIPPPAFSPGIRALGSISEEKWGDISASTRRGKIPTNRGALPALATDDEGWLDWCMPVSSSSYYTLS